MSRHPLALAALALSLLAMSSQARAPEGKKHALVVGVNEYEELTELVYAENDAEEMAKELRKCGFTVTLLTTRLGKKDRGVMPTAANIRKALATLVGGRGRADTVMVCLAGHGVQLEVEDPDGKERSKTYPYFCPHDFAKGGISFETGNAPNLVSLNWLFRQLEDCPARRKVVMVDACRNLGKATAAKRYIDAKKVTVPDGVCAMFSCGPGEFAYEVDDLGGRGHGVFFHYVLEGLRGKAKREDGSVTWGRLTEYVAESVEREVPKLTKARGKQTPHQVTNVVGASPVLVEGGGEAPPKGGTEVAKVLKGEKDYQRAMDHVVGRGVLIDRAATIRYLKAAGDEKHPLALGKYATALHLGLGVAKDEAEARRLARACLAAVRKLAEEDKRPEAQVLFGELYSIGLGVEKDEKEAVRWNRKAAEQGHAEGQCNLAYMYLRGLGVEKDEKEAVRWYLKAADQGDAAGQTSLGHVYLLGQGVEKDYKEALRWYRKSAEQGHAAAQRSLGHVYFNGLGVEKDEEEAFKWYRKAADLGHAAGQCDIGTMYLNGLGVEKDYKEAVMWFRKAAGQGDAAGQTSLGNMYFSGQGVGKDEKEAIMWFRKAAEQGHAGGQGGLGAMYFLGQGVEKDYKEAVKWFRKAADQGDAGGQCNLAYRYLQGQGVGKDEKEAVKWFRKAAAQDHESAKKALKDLGVKGSEDAKEDTKGGALSADEARWLNEMLAAEKDPAEKKLLDAEFKAAGALDRKAMYDLFRKLK